MAEYRYSSLGQRVAKLTDQGFTTYLYGPDGQLLGESEYDATGSRQRSQSYLWLDSLPLASVQAQGSAPAKVLYLHSDHLNTPRLATSVGQQIVWQWQSDAFGNGTANQDPQGSGQQTVLNLRFPGQYFDAESGLHYNYFRDYDPQTGRYVESDPIGLEGGLNTFSYAENNPAKLIDPMGLSAVIPFEIPWIVTIPRAPTFPVDLFPPFQETRARGQTDPVQDVKPVKPGRDCDENVSRAQFQLCGRLQVMLMAPRGEHTGIGFRGIKTSLIQSALATPKEGRDLLRHLFND